MKVYTLPARSIQVTPSLLLVGSMDVAGRPGQRARRVAAAADADQAIRSSPPKSGAWGSPSASRARERSLQGRRLAVVVKAVMGSHFGGLVNSPPILEPILVGNGMFTGDQ